jgi:pilus assembly protein CpaE
MTIPNKKTRVMVICEGGPTQQQILSALSSPDEFDLVEVLDNLVAHTRHIRAADPEIILVDHQIGTTPTLDLLDDLAVQFPDKIMVAILPNDDPVRAQQVMLAGARGFLIQPFTQLSLLSTLRRMRDLESRRGQTQVYANSGAEKATPVRVLAVYSPRGGVGCSTLAANLAIALYEETGARVLLVEGKLFFGHLDMMLNLRTHNNLSDLIPHAHSLDRSIIEEVVVEHASGIQVLLGPSEVQTAQGIRPEDLYNVLASLQRLYDFIVIDAGSYLNDNTVTLLDTADRILLVTTPDLPSLHDTSKFILLGRTLAYPAGKMLITLNRSGLVGGIKNQDIESALHHELFAVVPEDGQQALRSLNRGIPLVIKYPRSPASRAIQKLAKLLLQIGTQERIENYPVKDQDLKKELNQAAQPAKA